MLDVWCAKGLEETLYFAVNSAKEVTIEDGDFQLLNGSMYSELFLTSEGSQTYALELWNHEGKLVQTLSGVSLTSTMKLPANIMLIKGKKEN